jgi:anaerobic ribonucleoside-triphosphate reductase
MLHFCNILGGQEMKIIKRNGSEVDFDLNKIVVAVSKANAACRKEELTQSQIVEIAEYVEFKISKANRALSVEEIQDIVENQIMAQGAFDVARLYVKYRYNRSLIRKANTTDNQILSLIECNNEEVKQ